MQHWVKLVKFKFCNIFAPSSKLTLYVRVVLYSDETTKRALQLAVSLGHWA